MMPHFLTTRLLLILFFGLLLGCSHSSRSDQQMTGNATEGMGRPSGRAAHGAGLDSGQLHDALLPRVDETIVISIVACGDPMSKYVSMLKRLLLSMARNKVRTN